MAGPTDPRMRTLDIRPHGAMKHHQAAERSGSSSALDKTLGKISDRTKVIAVKVTGSDVKDLDVAIIKATNHNKVPPKEKHVRTLIDAVKFGNRFTTDHILKMLPRRPATVKKWLIAIKCCVTYHRLVRETNGIFIDTAAQSGYLGPELELFKDNVSNSAWDFSAFIREYSRYLRKMVQVFKATGFFPEQEAFGTSSKFRDMELADLLTHVPQLSALMEEATLCMPERSAVTNGLVQIAVMLVLKECTMMYKSSEEAMMNIVDRFFSLEPEEATKVLVVYKGNQAAKEKLVQFMDVCKSSGLSQGVNLPAGLQAVPQDFMAGMEAHAAGEAGEEPEMPPVIEMPEPEPEKEETPKAPTPPESPEPEPEPEPEPQPDLMCLDTPRDASDRLPTPFEEPEDELTALWKGGGGGFAGGGHFAQAPPTGFIPTNAFLAGPTGMVADAAPNHSNNPFLMPTPAPPPPVAAPPAYGANGTGQKVTNVLGDLGLENLGIRKSAVVKSSEPMRKSPATLAIEYNPQGGNTGGAPPSLPAQGAPSPGLPPPAQQQPRASQPIIPPTPFYAPPQQPQAHLNYQAAPTGYHAPPMGYSGQGAPPSQGSYLGSYQAPPTGYQAPPTGFQSQHTGGYQAQHTGGYQAQHTGGYQPQQQQQQGFQAQHTGGYQAQNTGGFQAQNSGGYQPQAQQAFGAPHTGYQPQQQQPANGFSPQGAGHQDPFTAAAAGGVNGQQQYGAQRGQGLPNQFSGGVTGYNQLVGSQPGQLPAYGTSVTGGPPPAGQFPGGQTFGTSATGPVQGSNPFGSNAFGGNAF